jgi:hypothetical protein
VTTIIHDAPASTKSVAAPDLLTGALLYGAIGWPVFPCVPGEKVPATAHGFKDATTDRSVIQLWWQGNPDYNVAIATGWPGPDVLDVDDREGGTGWEAYEHLKRAGLLAGAQMLVRTRSGGRHVYFAGSDQRNAAYIGSANLDFRATGGYVLAPPSYVISDAKGPGGSYELLDEREATGVKFRLDVARRLLTPSGQPKPLHTGCTSNPGCIIGWVARLPEGKRNSGLFWAACKLTENGRSNALDELADAAAATGLSGDEIARTIASAVRTVGA